MINPADIVRKALSFSNLNQEDFSKTLGKSQSQISKYLSEKSLPPSDTLIHCMNIIETHKDKTTTETPYQILLTKVQKLEGSQNSHICEALLGVLNALDKEHSLSK
ncbi:helix-turn-helix transcriptional regulator [Vibrio sp. HN007]|uniref:helix-turn-helix domain-containing protein n=1 Tax=Vibrio iocasae TaxID=3098914 RepID=UPI0035D420B7